MSGLLTAHRKNVLLVLTGCAVLPYITARAMPRLFPESLAIVLTVGVAMAVAALSLNLLLGYAGQISLGHAAFIGIGAFGASTVVDRWRGPMVVGFLLAAVLGALISLLIGLPALRLRGLFLALVTIVFGLSVQASLFRWDVFTRGSVGVALPRRIVGEHMVANEATFLSVALVVLVGVWLVDRNVMHTKLGRAFRAIREDETAAQSFAIDVTRYKLFAFVIAGAVAGLGGALYGHAVGFVNSDAFTLEMSLRVLAFVIIGGIGRRWGAATAAILLSLSPKLPSLLQGYEFVLAALVLLYNVVRFPEGLAGLMDIAVGRARARRTAGEAEPTLRVPVFPVIPHKGGDERLGDTVLTARGISVRFGGLVAVDDVSIEVRRRTVVGLIGPNGAGKTTLFNAIAGSLPASASSITLDGVEIAGEPAWARATAGIGRTFQLVGLPRELTVRESILLAQHRYARYGDASALFFTRRVAGTEAELSELTDRIIEELGFARYADTPVGRLSIGQQRLVEIAAVLAQGPKLLMLDEPSAGLSPAAAEQLAERLTELRDEHGQTILLIEHNVPLVLDVCDHVYVMNAGAMLAEGEPRSLARKPEILSAYLGEVRV